MAELEVLPQQDQRFAELLTAITGLTHQLERRYRGVLPFYVDATPLQRLATQLHIRRDPARVLWQRNDRYEHKMLELRQQRRTTLEYYFALNKQLRKQLHTLIRPSKRTAIPTNSCGPWWAIGIFCSVP